MNMCTHTCRFQPLREQSSIEMISPINPSARDATPSGKHSGNEEKSPSDKSSGDEEKSPSDKHSGDEEKSPSDKSSGDEDKSPDGDHGSSHFNINSTASQLEPPSRQILRKSASLGIVRIVPRTTAEFGVGAGPDMLGVTAGADGDDGARARGGGGGGGGGYLGEIRVDGNLSDSLAESLGESGDIESKMNRTRSSDSDGGTRRVRYRIALVIPN